MVDIHCHILPGIDDGPPDTEGSIALARALSAGAFAVTATPHLRSDHPRVIVGELAGRCESLNETLSRHDVKLVVVPAAEVDLLWAQIASTESLVRASYGQRGTDLLVETPYGPLPPNFKGLLSQLVSEGFRILLAHPERNPTFSASRSVWSSSWPTESWSRPPPPPSCRIRAAHVRRDWHTRWWWRAWRRSSHPMRTLPPGMGDRRCQRGSTRPPAVHRSGACGWLPPRPRPSCREGPSPRPLPGDVRFLAKQHVLWRCEIAYRSNTRTCCRIAHEHGGIRARRDRHSR